MRECDNNLLTVLLPVSRVDNLLLQAVDSLIEQTYSKYLCYVLLPNELQSNLEELNSIFKFDKRFKLIFLDLEGIAFALNYGINLSKTKYIARMDADDISLPNRFELQISYMELNNDVAILGGKIELIDENNLKLNKEFKYYQFDSEIRSALKYRMPLCHPSLMFRADILKANKGYMYGNTAEDHELFLRMARNIVIKFHNLPELLLFYRKHKYQSTDIKNAKNAFNNIAGFLFTEFLRSGNILYLFGIVANSPLSRKIREFLTKQ